MKEKLKLATVVLSDIHMGSEHAQVSELVSFLKEVQCDKLILNGDILDGWKLKRKPIQKWKPSYNKLFKVVLKKMRKDGTQVVYVRGNHDDFLDKVIPLSLPSIKVVRDYVHTSHGKRYYVTHGDIFDHITTNMVWLAKLGDVGYTLLLWMNKRINDRRKRKGKPYYSFSQSMKNRVKSAVSYISDFERELTELAKSRNFDGVICGHIHHPANTHYGSVHYLNSGDWVESLSALLEYEDGHWEVYRHANPLQLQHESTPS